MQHAGQEQHSTTVGGGLASRIWGDEEVRALLGVWCEAGTQRLLSHKSRNKEVYAMIAGRLRELGYRRDWIQCRVKVKNLKYEYKVARDGTFRGGPGHYARCMRLYPDLDRVLTAAAAAAAATTTSAAATATTATTPSDMCTSSIIDNGEQRQQQQQRHQHHHQHLLRLLPSHTQAEEALQHLDSSEERHPHHFRQSQHHFRYAERECDYEATPLSPPPPPPLAAQLIKREPSDETEGEMELERERQAATDHHHVYDFRRRMQATESPGDSSLSSCLSFGMATATSESVAGLQLLDCSSAVSGSPYATPAPSTAILQTLLLRPSGAAASDADRTAMPDRRSCDFDYHHHRRRRQQQQQQQHRTDDCRPLHEQEEEEEDGRAAVTSQPGKSASEEEKEEEEEEKEEVEQRQPHQRRRGFVVSARRRRDRSTCGVLLERVARLFLRHQRLADERFQRFEEHQRQLERLHELRLVTAIMQGLQQAGGGGCSSSRPPSPPPPATGVSPE